MALKPQTIKAAEALDKVFALYEALDHRHASDILLGAFPKETLELCTALLTFRLTNDIIKAPGGNESAVPKAISKILRPVGWEAKNLVMKQTFGEKGDEQVASQQTHKIDYIKGRVAFDLEWNSKDQTFDRDLLAFRAFFEFDQISAGVIVTRSTALHAHIKKLGTYIDKKTGEKKAYIDKYGASTTHMDKLTPRIAGGRAGGCPVLALGITSKLVDE